MRAPLFDWRELRRWNISEQRLPAGSEVRFRPPGIWEEYRAEVTIALIAVLLQAAMITGLLFERHRRRQAEAQARSRLLETVHLNRTATVGAISASIVHEVNQPLATIVANASAGLRWLSRETPDLNETRAVLDSIVSAGHRVSELIGNVRSMFKKEAEKREFVDVNKLVRETLTFARGELENHRVVTHTQLSAGLPGILADRIQLQQVLLNLVMNAIEAMSALGDHQRVLQVRSQMYDGKNVAITVEDSGPGIDPKDIERVFEPFFTTKSHGMGMGLAICRSIIESHGGRLSALPALPQGTIFRVVLTGTNTPEEYGKAAE
jgi:C4-dicarboxylate-specific signal transduction histidine kinase